LIGIENSIFNASLVYECLTSVPFNAAVASQFLDYYNDTLQFQSTLTYLKTPPPSYQQPGVDLLGGLAALKQGIENGIFPNQYEFEAALQTLLYASHDGHVTLNAGILAAFSFSSPQEIVSLSLDGFQLPKVYLVKDLADSNFSTAYQPSAITSINDEDVVTYLTKFAAKNSIGMIEPHGDWNQLMRSAAQDIQGYRNTFTTATFYPGDTITFKLENGTSLTESFQATYYDLGDTGPLQTGGDFYNSFVLGLLPASYDPDLVDNNNINITAILDDPSSFNATTTDVPSAEPTDPASSEPTCGSWSNLAYPGCADTFQNDLGTFGGGFVSGYFLNSTQVAVLSIPSFQALESEAADFDAAIQDFITTSQNANMQKIVIDLQSNYGGSPIVATDTFRRFFPNIDAFRGSRLRAHPAANVMGSTITEYFGLFDSTDQMYEDLITNEWVATSRINADTNELFASWAEAFGPPLFFDGDNFTTTQRYDLTDTSFDSVAVDASNDTFTVFGYGSNAAPADAAPPYAAEDIIMVSSACKHRR
jgi:Peptidase family S41